MASGAFHSTAAAQSSMRTARTASQARAIGPRGQLSAAHEVSGERTPAAPIWTSVIRPMPNAP